MEILLSDLRYAFRSWRRSPGFVLVSALTLALGIGANTTIFSIVDATLLASPPYPEPDRLMTVWRGAIDSPQSTNITSAPNFKDWRAQNHTFQDLAILDSAGRGYGLTDGESEQVSGVRVTASFFSVLGVQPMLGRTFLPEEEEPGRDRVVVLSHGLWMRRFAADRAIVGKTIQMDGAAYTVVGVMPADFTFQFWSGPRQLWVPAGWTKGDYDRGSNSFICIGRLKRDATLAQARTDMDTIGRALAKTYPDTNSGNTIRVIPLSEIGLEDVKPTLFALLGVVGFVLLIACVNVANLMLARAATRNREMAIRSALGAGRARLVRQLLTESILLACLGGVCGLLIALAGTKLFLDILPSYFTRLPGRSGADTIDINLTVLAFTFGVSMLSGVLFGLAPALASFRTKDVNSPLKEQARGSTSGKSRLRYGLVASEVALTLVVLAGAGIMIVSVARLLDVSPGFDPKNVAVMSMSLPQEDLYYGPPGNPRFCEQLQENVGGVPGVLSVSAIGHLPMGGNAGRGIAIEGRPDPGPDNQPGASYSVACPNVLKTLGVTLLSGREFTVRDTVSSPGVVLINEAMAKRYWPKEEPVGKRFKIGGFKSDGPWLTIVGVFKSIRHHGLDVEPRPQFYRPYQQAGWPIMAVLAKTTSAPATFFAPIKSALRKMEPSHPVSTATTMEGIVGLSVSSRRFPMVLLSIFAALALVLAAVGIAGVVGYSVIQRTQEIGVRIALGAQGRDVLRLVLGHSLGWTLLGIGIGLIAAVGLLRLLESLVFGVTARDPFVLAVVSTILVTVALLASYIPARRALRVDPVSALRGE